MTARVTVTLAQLGEWGACYSDEEIHELAGGRTSASLEEILRRDDIRPFDRVWVAAYALPAPLRARWLERVVGAAIVDHCLGFLESEVVVEWGARWLLGEPTARTAEAALEIRLSISDPWPSARLQAVRATALAAKRAALAIETGLGNYAAGSADAVRAVGPVSESLAQIEDALEVLKGA